MLKLNLRLILTTIFVLQIFLMVKLQLFGDEAFYWLEGQFLDASYAELPGWTAWMIRLGTSIFGTNYFGVRIISYLAFLSTFLAFKLINKQLSPHTWMLSHSGLILASIPLYVLIAVMALPDVWLVFFVMWISYFFIKAVMNDSKFNWVIVGLLVALSINVHVRMWIWLFFAGLSFLFYYAPKKKILFSAVYITLPIALLGLLPILVFNVQNDYALFVFQFGTRHPWHFQLKNLVFIVAQFIVISPIVWCLWLVSFRKLKAKALKPTPVKWMLLTSLSHGLLYVIMGLFADGLRTNVHWLLVSYVPVLSLYLILESHKKLIKWALVTGITASVSILLFFTISPSQTSHIQARIFDNSLGWKELSTTVKKIQIKQNLDYIIADYFMTAAELAFELNQTSKLSVLPHEKNTKHGRQKQLKIMGLLLNEPQNFTKQALLVVEDSTLKLQDKGKYYAQLCEYFSHLEWLQALNIPYSKKQFQFFKVGNNKQQTCDIPPLFYVQSSVTKKQLNVSGWVVFHNKGIKSLSIVSSTNEELITNFRIPNIGIEKESPEINDPNRPNNGFEISINLEFIQKSQFKIKAQGSDQKTYFSQLYFID